VTIDHFSKVCKAVIDIPQADSSTWTSLRVPLIKHHKGDSGPAPAHAASAKEEAGFLNINIVRCSKWSVLARFWSEALIKFDADSSGTIAPVELDALLQARCCRGARA
jgi:hypothetical protein